MPITAPPVETAWLLHHVLGFDAQPEADTAAILEEATRTAEGLLAPLDREGDTSGAWWEEGEVTLPHGFAEAHRAFAEAGWVGIAASPDHGGQGLPARARRRGVGAVHQRQRRASASARMLTYDAVLLLEAHGTRRPAGPFVATDAGAARWSGTMCLTEPQSGSDLSGVRTRATPDGDGRYRIDRREDLHHLRRAPDDREHPAHGARPAAGRAARQRRHLAVRRAQAQADGSRNGVRCNLASNASSASTPAPPA